MKNNRTITRVVAGALTFVLAALLICGCGKGEKPSAPDSTGVTDNMGNEPTSDHSSFSYVWGVNGISSYDSETGKLVKTTDATHPEKYETTYMLSESETAQIHELIGSLDILSYPDEYNPNEGVYSSPSMTLILSVKDGDTEKTVKAEDIAYSYSSEDEKGQKFLSVCKAIEEILTGSEEWKALPDYEFLYD